MRTGNSEDGPAGTDVKVDNRRSTKIFVINLVRRTDRLAHIAIDLARLDLKFERVEAVDAASVSEELLNRYFEPKGPLGRLGAGDKCCTLSHRLAWTRLVTSDSAYQFGVFLEDDARLSDDFGEIVRDLSWVPAGVHLIKLERFGKPNNRILLSKAQGQIGRRTLHRLLSKHTGSAGYILSRQYARIALQLTERMNVSIDHLLFNRNNSPVSDRLAPYQMCPAIVEQSVAIAGGSDIVPSRLRVVPTGLSYWRRELRNFYFEYRYLPRQLC